MKETNTKILCVESITDHALAWLISLPAPFTTVAVVVIVALVFAAGKFL